MIDNLISLKKILSPKEYRFLFLLFILMIIASLIETLSIGLIIPIIAFFINPDLSNSYYEYTYNLYQKFDFLSPILTVMLSLLIIYLIKFLYLIFFNKTQGKYLLNLKVSLSKKMFTGYLLKPYSFHKKHNSSFLISNIENEIGIMISNVLSPFLVFTLNLLTVFCITILLLFYNFLSTLIIISIFSSVAILLNLFFKKKLTLIGKIRTIHQRFNLQHLRQGFGSIKEIKLLGIEKYFINKYNYHNFELAKLGLKKVVISLIPKLTFEYLFLVIIFILVLLTEIKNESLDNLVPLLIVYSLCAYRLMPALNAITSSYQKMKFGKPALEIINKQLPTDQEINLKENDFVKFSFIKDIKFQNISFSYPDDSKKVLSNINFSIAKNKITGIIGKNGSGKSTLINLICGLSDPTEGIIHIDSKKMQENLKGWQELIGYVPQSIYVSDDTILSNIAIGIEKSKINKHLLDKAITLAQLDNMISELPDGLETKIGEKGTNISGGQKQKIGIARALYRNPEILIFDESTSSMDLISEQQFTEDVKRLSSEKTIIIVAHRLSALKYCEKIYRIENQTINLEK